MFYTIQVRVHFDCVGLLLRDLSPPEEGYGSETEIPPQTTHEFY